MSVGNVSKFYAEVLQNNQQLIEQFKGVNSSESFYKLTVQLGQENGYTFTSEDVEVFLSQKQSERAEMTGKDLEAIASGKGRPFSAELAYWMNTRITLNCGFTGTTCCALHSIC